MKQKRWIQPIIVGFLTIYLFIMLLATYMTSLKFSDEYLTNLNNSFVSVVDMVTRHAENTVMTNTERIIYYKDSISSIINAYASKHQFLSGAIYDSNGTLIAETDNIVHGNIHKLFLTTSLDRFSSEKLSELADFVYANHEKYYNRLSGFSPYEYDILAKLSDYNKNYRKELNGIVVKKTTWEIQENVESATYPLYQEYYGIIYKATNTETIWECSIPNKGYHELLNATITMPYLWLGKNYWQKWCNSDYIHDFEEQLTDLSLYNEMAEDNYWNEIEQLSMKVDAGVYRLPKYEKFSRVLTFPNDTYYYVEVRSNCNIWLAAMDYLKYVYFTGFFVMLACMLKIIYVTNKTYKQREAIEENRRDFINAIAHELKMPLGIIRGFAENLQERTIEEKRDYYLEKIINQTEEMDDLVAEMIEISKLDSEKLILQQEMISLHNLCQEQLKRLDTIIQEKNLHIEYIIEEDCKINGDRKYLEKAIWNLLNNAVTYNIPNGNIRIIFRKNELRIENTSIPLDKELLSHAFEMFYSKNNSNSKEKHMGVGLFLTKKILTRHNINITLENIEDTVRVTLYL